jgi:DNA repair exonuclease SbcCD ATPase subunit
MSGNQTYDEIISSAKTQKARLERLMADADTRIDAIMRAGAGNLSSNQEAELTSLNEDRKALSASIRRIDLVTLEQLDKTDELQQLVASLKAVGDDLQQRRARILRFASKVEEVGMALEGVSTLATNIDGIRKKIRELSKPTPAEAELIGVDAFDECFWPQAALST